MTWGVAVIRACEFASFSDGAADALAEVSSPREFALDSHGRLGNDRRVFSRFSGESLGLPLSAGWMIAGVDEVRDGEPVVVPLTLPPSPPGSG